MDGTVFWTYAVVGLLIALGVFLLIRAFWLWYWKVNVVVGLLRDIRDALTEQNRLSHDTRRVTLAPPSVTLEQSAAHPFTGGVLASNASEPQHAACPDCGALNDPDADRCRSCRRYLR